MTCVGMFTCLVCCERETRVERMVWYLFFVKYS
jgi:hypothetical protein